MKIAGVVEVVACAVILLALLARAGRSEREIDVREEHGPRASTDSRTSQIIE